VALRAAGLALNGDDPAADLNPAEIDALAEVILTAVKTGHGGVNDMARAVLYAGYKRGNAT